MLLHIEKVNMTATLTKWYEERGRHDIFAGNKSAPLSSKDHSLVLVGPFHSQSASRNLPQQASRKNGS